MRTRTCTCLIALVLMCLAQPAYSLGLGDARVQSFIGQPLELRIDLLTGPNDDLESVSARLASADDFALIGASRSAISAPLSFTVHEGRAGNGAYILVGSRMAINDPVLRLVIEVNWSSGRLLREYTVFLDPPTIPARVPQPETARAEPRREPPVASPADSVVTPPAEPAPPPQVTDSTPAPDEAIADEPPRVEAAPESASAGEIAEGEEYGPVRTGETLWRIASNYVGQSGMDMNQVMMAIQRRNPDAFVNGNINLLKRGATLALPSAREVDELSAQEAREMVAQQEAAFRLRASLASTSTPLLAADSSSADAAPGATSQAVPSEPEADEEAAPEARLEIVPATEEDLSASQPGTGAVPGGEGSEEIQRELREELARTEEELFSERQQNEYLRERISELEAQLSEADESAGEGLVADDELANLEDRLLEERMEAAEEPAEPAPETMPSVTTSPAAGEDRPWYSGPTVWFIMILIVAAAIFGWLFNRRRAVEYDLSAHAETDATVAGLKGEAEEILRTLDADRESAREEDRTEPMELDEEVPAWRRRTPRFDETETVDAQPEPRRTEPAEPDRDEPVVSFNRARRSQREDSGEAKLLDESSSDPEIKLDLARAYISMGDKEAARVILGEVMNLGTDAQKSEARSMMDEL